LAYEYILGISLRDIFEGDFVKTHALVRKQAGKLADSLKHRINDPNRLRKIAYLRRFTSRSDTKKTV
jgi:hypothetical protein